MPQLAKILSLLRNNKPKIYELVITQDGLSLEGNEKLGAHIEDILHYVEKKSDELDLGSNVEIYIKTSKKVIGIKRIGGLGVAVVSSSINDVFSAIEDIESRVFELLRDRYEEVMEEYRRSK